MDILEPLGAERLSGSYPYRRLRTPDEPEGTVINALVGVRAGSAGYFQGINHACYVFYIIGNICQGE